jgi:hypothetical protein
MRHTNCETQFPVVGPVRSTKTRRRTISVETHSRQFWDQERPPQGSQSEVGAPGNHKGRMKSKVGAQASDKFETMQVLRFNSVWKQRKSWALCKRIRSLTAYKLLGEEPFSTWFTSHFTLSTPDFTLHTLHSTLHTSQFTLSTSPFTLDTSHFTVSTLHFTLSTPHFALHTSPTPAMRNAISQLQNQTSRFAPSRATRFRDPRATSRLMHKAPRLQLQNVMFCSNSYRHSEGRLETRATLHA